jgi:hypothetical protein
MAVAPPPMDLVVNVTVNGKPLVDAINACSFCGKGLREVGRLIRGPGRNICDECCWLCFDLLFESPGTLFAIAEGCSAALLRLVEAPWDYGTSVGGRTGKEKSPYSKCPGCGLSADLDVNRLDPAWHYNIEMPCPWVLAARTLLGMEAFV